ncbi:MAG: hypothetical protein BKPUNTRY_000724 [Candidatus Fervidibacter sp.]
MTFLSSLMVNTFSLPVGTERFGSGKSTTERKCASFVPFDELSLGRLTRCAILSAHLRILTNFVICPIFLLQKCNDFLYIF